MEREPHAGAVRSIGLMNSGPTLRKTEPGDGPPQPSKVKRWVAAAIVTVVAGIAIVRLYAEFVPVGTNPIPWLLAQQPNPGITGPSGREYLIRYCDAGAAHSGPHWTWVYTHDPIWGLTVMHGCFMSLDDVRDGLQYDRTSDPQEVVFYGSPTKRSSNWVKTTLALP